MTMYVVTALKHTARSQSRMHPCKGERSVAHPAAISPKVFNMNIGPSLAPPFPLPMPCPMPRAAARCIVVANADVLAREGIVLGGVVW